MAWGTIEAEPEVAEWLLSLDDEDFGQAERYIDLLADEGVHLSEPFTRQLRGKLRELRFYLGRSPTRITYYIPTGRRIVLLTVFAKTGPRERAEVERAWRALQRRIAEGHVAEEAEVTKRTSWDDLKASRRDSRARRRGYDKAGRAIRLAFEIRALREKKGLSQRELAERVGTTQSAIARLEAGRTSPSLPTLDKVAAALGAEVSLSIIDLDELAGRR